MENARVTVPSETGEMFLEFKRSHSIVLLGANGSGKTRLGVFIEEGIPGQNVLRIPAHRSLTIKDDITSVAYERAKTSLHFGNELDRNPTNRRRHKYSNKPATFLLNDYEKLLQTLFSEQSSVAVRHLNAQRIDPGRAAPETVLNRLKTIWMKVLPHRALHLMELSIQAYPAKQEGNFIQGLYAASEMSDGERVILYLIGDCLLAPANAVVIVDEPELHVHKALMNRLWDTIESARKDCCFVYITHDLDFAMGRATSAKYVIRAYWHPGKWDVEELRISEEIPDRVYAELVGSRQPVLFVEGQSNSIDVATYRYCYPTFLVKPLGSCDSVIHAVASINHNRGLHQVTAQGCIDSDARNEAEIEHLKGLNVHVLPVAEIENIFLVPPIFLRLAEELSFNEDQANNLLSLLVEKVIAKAEEDLEPASVRYAVRRIDARLKALTPSARIIADLETKLMASFKAVNPIEIADSYKGRLLTAINTKDLRKILAMLDNKGLLSIATEVLGLRNKNELVEFVGRRMADNKGSEMLSRIRSELPLIETASII